MGYSVSLISVDFAGAADARHAGEGAQGDADVDVFEVIPLCSLEFQPVAVAAAALFGDGDTTPPGQIVARDATSVFGFQELLRLAGGDDLAALHARAGAQVEQVITG